MNELWEAAVLADELSQDKRIQIRLLPNRRGINIEGIYRDNQGNVSYLFLDEIDWDRLTLMRVNILIPAIWLIHRRLTNHYRISGKV